MRSRTRMIPVMLALLAGASTAAAQDAAKPDTLPFHKSQWAAQFVVGTEFVSAGVLHFRSAKSAWLLDGSFRYSYNNSHTNGDTLYPPTSFTQSFVGARLRFGLRGYHPLGNSTQFFTTFGALVQGSGAKLRGGVAGNDWSWGAGVFGELGANYMITPHIGFGAAAGIDATYNQQGTERLYGGTSQSISVSGALLSLQIGIYF